MIIRSAKAGDAAGIAQVHVQSWRETYRGIMPDGLLDNLSVERRQAWWETVIAEQLDESPLFVAANNHNEIVAFASGGAVRGEFESYDCELYAIYALKSAQGQGIGRQLMQYLARSLHELGYKAMMLWVANGNPTEQFYAHMGGQRFAEKAESLGDIEIIEMGYGWLDIQTLLANIKD